jgi:hypothetical protein
LSDDLRSSAGEVEGKGCLIGTEVIDVEDEFLGQVLGVTPYDPTDTRVNESVLVSGDVDRRNFGKTEVPEQTGVNEGGDETTRCSIDVDININVAFNKEVVDGFYVFVFTGVCRS